MADEGSVRLFVGGLAPEVTPEDLKARFASFGAVASCEIAPPKFYCGQVFQRGFGYVDLVPKDPTSLAKCLSLYNGSKWRGCVLRCGIARPDYRTRLNRELESFQESAEAESMEEALEHEGDSNTLHIRLDRSLEVVAVAVAGNGSARAIALEESVASPRAATDWDALATPPGARYTFEKHLEKVKPICKKRLQEPTEETEEEAKQSAWEAWLNARDSNRSAIPAAKGGITTKSQTKAKPTSESKTAPPMVARDMDMLQPSQENEDGISSSESSGASELAEFLEAEGMEDSLVLGVVEDRGNVEKSTSPGGKKEQRQDKKKKKETTMLPKADARTLQPAALPSRLRRLEGVVTFTDGNEDDGQAQVYAADLSRFDDDSDGVDGGLLIPQVDGAAPHVELSTTTTESNSGVQSKTSEEGTASGSSTSSGSSEASTSSASSESTSSSSSEEETTSPSSESSSSSSEEDTSSPGSSSGDSSSSSESEGATSTSSSARSANSSGSDASQRGDDKVSSPIAHSNGKLAPSSPSSSDSVSSDDSESSASAATSSSSDNGSKADSGSSATSSSSLKKNEESGDEEESAVQTADDKYEDADAAPAWAAGAFPEGAAFVKAEHTVESEAAWRAQREGLVIDYKAKKRQAARLQVRGLKQRRKDAAMAARKKARMD